jgi:hypothetical protein
MCSDDVSASVEFLDLRGCQKSALADEIGRDETMAAKAQRLEPVGDERVVGNPAVVEGHDRRGRAARNRDPQPDETIELCLEVAQRQLVAIGRGGAEATLRRIRHVHVMKEQGYGSHVVCVAPPISSADMQ